jgi:hypothetical protein
METERMWNVKTTVIPVTIGAIGTYTRSLRKYLKRTGDPRNQGSKENSHIGHFAHTSGSINVKVLNIQHGNNIKFTINCNYRIAATLHTLVASVSQVQNCKHPA